MLVLHTSKLTAANDALAGEVEERNMVAIAGTAQSRTRWRTTQETPARVQWDLDTRSRRSPQSHGDHLVSVPDLLVRTVCQADWVGILQDENRRSGDACDSLCY